MTTVAEIQSRVFRLLSNTTPDADAKSLFYDAFGAALDAILPWFPKTAIKVYTGTGVDSYELPDSLYSIETFVDDATGEMLPQASLIPLLHRGINIEITNDWIEFPSGWISFSKALSVGKTYTLFYLTHWSKPISDDDKATELKTPDFLNTALTLYTTAQMLIPDAISASTVRQYNTKVDSGNPEHNPMRDSASYLLKLFSEEMNRHPRYQRAQR